jgi:hypothetical protein
LGSRIGNLLKLAEGEETPIVYIPEGSDISTNVRSQTFPQDLIEEVQRLVQNQDDFDWESETLFVGFLGAAVADNADYDVHLQCRQVNPSDIFQSQEQAIRKMSGIVLTQNQMPAPTNMPKTSYFATILMVQRGVVMPGNKMIRILTTGQVTPNLELFGSPAPEGQ